ncbi:acyltransferase family protein [Bradyrhizobium nitroreducens]|uniref:acyltransferase family protein n=1 Tax=Bradyrhizobium nitroreducens TaxID=709803 RepID=UPI0024BF97DB|nr:acyltransferase family protein [Bradyrhizobium nitroreducens]
MESLRGLAAVSVVAYHAFGRSIDTNVTGLAPVVLFFVLSGFVLARSLARGPTIAEFFRHRVFRLFPAGIAAVLLLTALHAQFGFYHGFPPDFSAFNVLLNALMLKHDINGPMWSMTVECLATPVILATFWICQRFGWQRVLPAIVILFGLSFVGQFTHLLGGFSNLGPLYAFLVGVVLHFTGKRFVEALTSNGGPSLQSSPPQFSRIAVFKNKLDG